MLTRLAVVAEVSSYLGEQGASIGHHNLSSLDFSAQENNKSRQLENAFQLPFILFANINLKFSLFLSLENGAYPILFLGVIFLYQGRVQMLGFYSNS